MSRPRGEGRSRHRARVRARAWALQVHYRWEAEGWRSTLLDALEDTLRDRYVAEPRRSYLRRLVETLHAHLEEVDRSLQGCLENWSLDRLARIDRGVLRLGATELLYVDDVPPKVSLKEFIRLAERYGSDDSAAFVNGVLDALHAAIEEDGGDSECASSS